MINDRMMTEVKGCNFREMALRRWADAQQARKKMRAEEEENAERVLEGTLAQLGVKGVLISNGVAVLNENLNIGFDSEGSFELSIQCPNCGQVWRRTAYHVGDLLYLAGELYNELYDHEEPAGPGEPGHEPSSGSYDFELGEATKILDNTNGNEAAYLQGIGHALIALVEELRLHRS